VSGITALSFSVRAIPVTVDTSMNIVDGGTAGMPA
jgi:hypothetical protein